MGGVHYDSTSGLLPVGFAEEPRELLRRQLETEAFQAGTEQEVGHHSNPHQAPPRENVQSRRQLNG